MARIRVYVRQSPRTIAETVLDNSGGSIVLPFLRVYSVIRIGLRSRQVADCVIDTGAPLSVFPRQTWETIADEIEWLNLPSGRAKESWVVNLRGRTGGQSKCRIGRIFAELFDLERPQQFLPGDNIIAQFEEQRFPDDRIIIGLHGGILDHRRLILQPDLQGGWIEEQ